MPSRKNHATLGEPKGTKTPSVDRVALYTGRVLLDDDEQNLDPVTIDIRTPSSWSARLRGRTVPVPSQSQDFTVRLCEGDRNGQIANARFGPRYRPSDGVYFLLGTTAFRVPLRLTITRTREPPSSSSAVSLGTRLGLTSPLVLEVRTRTRRPDIASELGGRARASERYRHTAQTAAAAWFGDRFGALTWCRAER